MKNIEFEEIKDLYKRCGLSNEQNFAIRTDINLGTLENKLNSNFQFMSKDGQNYYSNNTLLKRVFTF